MNMSQETILKIIDVSKYPRGKCLIQGVVHKIDVATEVKRDFLVVDETGT